MLSFILIISISGCATNQSKLGGSTDDKTLTIAQGADMVSFDIHNHNNTSTEAIHTNMFDYLVKRDKNMQLQPDLATSWKQINDKTMRFKLRKGVKFHNGDPFTANDVKFTLERVAKDGKLLDHPNYVQIKEVKVVDDYTVDIITNQPEPVLLNRVSRIASGILPSKYIKEKGWDYFLKHPIGTGPYQFVEWNKGDRIVLKANKNYFGSKPKWNKLIFRVIPEDSTRVAELLSGDVDIAMNVPPEDWDRINKNDQTYVAKSPSQRVMMLEVRQTKGTVTANPKVREAIDLAIDKKTIVDSLFDGAATLTRTRVTPGNNGANEDLYKKTLYDPEKAKQLLKEAGYGNGLTLHLSAPSGRYLKDKESAELIASMLGKVGIKVKLDLLEWSRFSEKYSSKSFNELFLIGFGNSMMDASNSLTNLKQAEAKGETDYVNPKTQRLLEKAEHNMNSDSRNKEYAEAQELIANDRPNIYLYQLDQVAGVKKNIKFTPRLDEMIYADDITTK